MTSSGDHGVEGTSNIKILPGSSFEVFCNATGSPKPTVKWIRAGSVPIDPSWVSQIICSNFFNYLCLNCRKVTFYLLHLLNRIEF